MPEFQGSGRDERATGLRSGETKRLLGSADRKYVNNSPAAFTGEWVGSWKDSLRGEIFILW